jgi:hypothetical protein
LVDWSVDYWAGWLEQNSAALTAEQKVALMVWMTVAPMDTQMAEWSVVQLAQLMAGQTAVS